MPPALRSSSALNESYCKLFYMLFLSSFTLLSLVGSLFARLEQRGKSCMSSIEICLWRSLFQLEKGALDRAPPNPIATFKVWLILCQRGICHLRHKALFYTRLRSLFSYLLLKAYPQQTSIHRKSVGRGCFVCAFIWQLGSQEFSFTF